MWHCEACWFSINVSRRWLFIYDESRWVPVVVPGYKHLQFVRLAWAALAFFINERILSSCWLIVWNKIRVRLKCIPTHELGLGFLKNYAAQKSYAARGLRKYGNANTFCIICSFITKIAFIERGPFLQMYCLFLYHETAYVCYLWKEIY